MRNFEKIHSRCRRGGTFPRRRSRHGFTLVELIIYMVLCLIVLGIVTFVFTYVSRAYSKASSSFDVQREFQTGVEQIRRDLAQASLGTITVYPSHGEAQPGFSMLSALAEEQGIGKTTGRDSFELTRYGVPNWQRYVFYTLAPRAPRPEEVDTPFQGKIGNVVRWTYPIGSSSAVPYPIPTDIHPSSFASHEAPTRVILRGIILPDAPQIKGMEHFVTDQNDCGGFQVAFIRQERDATGKVTGEYLSGVNPAQATSGKDTDDVSGLVQVSLSSVYISDRTGKLSAYSLSFCVYPKN